MSADAKAERREYALYAATTHTTKRTLLSDAAIEALCEAHLELHSDLRALEKAHEMQDQALDEALRQRDGLRRELARYRRETGGEG